MTSDGPLLHDPHAYPSPPPSATSSAARPTSARSTAMLCHGTPLAFIHRYLVGIHCAPPTLHLHGISPFLFFFVCCFLVAQGQPGAMVLFLRALGDLVRNGVASEAKALPPPPLPGISRQELNSVNEPTARRPLRCRCRWMLASSPPRRGSKSPRIRNQHQMYTCSLEERSTQAASVLRVPLTVSADAALHGVGHTHRTEEDWRCFVATSSDPVMHHAVLSLTSVDGHEVRADATREVMEMGEGNGSDEVTVDGDADGSGYRFPDLSQPRPGTRHAFGGRTVGTGRNTRANLLQGYLLAIATTITKIGVEKWLEEFGVADDDRGGAAALRSFLERTLTTPYRGQVWPLESVFGAMARISDTDQHLYKEQELMTCWVAPRGDIQCTCCGSTAKEATLDVEVPTVGDDGCYHAKLFGDALASVGVLLGDQDGQKTRRFVSRVAGADVPADAAVVNTTRTGGTVGASGARRASRAARGRGGRVSTRSGNTRAPSQVNDVAEDAEVEVFHTGGLPIAVVVAGEGRRRVPAPVKCARKTTSCCYCDTSRKKSCVHVLHTRHLRQGDTAGSATVLDSATPTIVKAISHLELSAFNCDQSVKVDMDLLYAARDGKTYFVPAPEKCPTCATPRGSAAADPSKGTVLSEICVGEMELDAYTCSNKECGKWVCAEGRKEGLVILSPCTAASVTLVRHFASQVAVEGNPFSQTFRTWWTSALERRRAGVWSSATPGRGRRTVSRLLSVGLRLMGKDAPFWPFFCDTCCDGDEIDVVTADGIWLGYLRRLLFNYYATYSEKCDSNPTLIHAASLIGSEWVRRYIRLALTEPGATIAVSTEQRKTAALALAVLLPGVMPQSFLNTFSADQKASADALHSLLSVIWDLDLACVQLVKGVHSAMTKFIAASETNNRPLPDNAVERDVAVKLSAWLAARPVGAGRAAVAGPPVAAAAAAAAGAAAAAAVAAAADAAAAAAAAGNANIAELEGAPAQDPAAAAAAAAAAAGGRRPSPTTAFEVLAPGVRSLGATVAHDLVAFCVAVASDPVVSAFNLEHASGLRGLAALLRSSTLAADLPVVLNEAVKVGPVGAAFPVHLSSDMVVLLKELRMGVAFLNALKQLAVLRDDVAVATAGCLDKMADALTAYHAEQPLVADSAALFGANWCGDGMSREEMRAKFLSVFPDASDDPLVTGMYFPGRPQCRASAFQRTEKPDLGVCSKNYQDARKSSSPGAFIICCACSHPKVLGFVVLDKREGPPALLDAIITRFSYLPRFIVYDFGCGAVRSALGKLPWLLAVSTVVSDAFHIINHVCSKFFAPASFTILKHMNTVAHEQRNRAIKALKRVLAACGPVEYTSILSYHMLVQNIRAAARDSCTTSLPESFDFSSFYFSRVKCACGCGHGESDEE